MHTTFTIYWNLSILALPLCGGLWTSLTDTLDTHELKRMQKAQQEQWQQQQQQGQQNTKSYMVYEVGGRKDVKKLFSGSHVLEFGFGVGVSVSVSVLFVFCCCWVCCQLLGIRIIRHSQNQNSKGFRASQLECNSKGSSKRNKNTQKKSNEAYKICWTKIKINTKKIHKI